MATLNEFVEEYNVLVIEETATEYFQVFDSGSEQIWQTYPVPADGERISSDIANLSLELSTGKHNLRVQAMAKGGIIRGQKSLDVEGRSAAAKQAGSEQIQHAKALQMNIQTADIQLNSMNSRLQAADERARVAEERAGAMIADGFKMQDLVNRMIIEKESVAFDREERESRMRSFNTIAETLAPILGQAIVIGSKYMEHKVNAWEAEWEAEAKAKAKVTKEKRDSEDDESNNVVSSKVVNETSN